MFEITKLQKISFSNNKSNIVARKEGGSKTAKRARGSDDSDAIGTDQQSKILRTDI